jgi:fumarate reductase flavoprotein subunit
VYNFIENKSCDLVVLGSGSGLIAAVRAAQLTGKKVIVLEKTAVTGGGCQFAATVRTFGSKWQSERGLPDTTAEFARAMMDKVYWRLDARLVANALLGTGQFFDWLCEQESGLADRFSVGKYVFGIESDPLGPQIDQFKLGYSFGRVVMDTMKKKYAGYGVEVLTQHPAVDVEVANGKIIAVIAKSEAGYVRVACKACILATGNWISNEDIIKKYCPEFVGMRQEMGRGPMTSDSKTGDGIPLAEKAGAFVDYSTFCLRLMPSHHCKSRTFQAMVQSPFVITVNLNGQRFVAEPLMHMNHFEDGHVQVAQPRGRTFDIFDENTLAAAFKAPKRKQAFEVDKIVLGEINFPDTMEEVYRSIDDGFAQGDTHMFKSDSLEELADKTGINKDNFLTTIRKYNDNCRSGVDLDFFKSKDALVPINKPPYYAFMVTLSTDGAFGGVRVNPDMQAYKPDGSLVEGLYVTGDFASGRFLNLGGVKQQVLNDVSWAFSSGFLAGTNAGKYLESLK